MFRPQSIAVFRRCRPIAVRVLRPRGCWLLATWLIVGAGCVHFPVPVYEPAVHNPFPHLMRVAIAPFFNLSAEPSVDGRQFALAYYNELQSVPGFEVTPIGVVESTIQAEHLSLDSAEDVRRLAELLDADAVVVGAITDFSPYYPPRCGMRVEWYAADPSLQPILPGDGLPWDGPEGEQIPERLAYESQMAHARAKADQGATHTESEATPDGGGEADGPRLLSAMSRADASRRQHAAGPTGTAAPIGKIARGKLPRLEAMASPPAEPVMRHTETYNGNDPKLTEALAAYVSLHDERRYGGWPSYLERSDDFIRFCCHLHISKMLTARGGAGKTQVRWRWPADR